MSRMRMKLLIIGHGRHGKVSVAEIIQKAKQLTFTSSSMTAANLFIFDAMKDMYNSPEECYNDRINHRATWFKLITDFNKNDPSMLAKKILLDNDIYVGMRSRREFEHSKSLFDHVIWVDASKRLPYEYSTMELEERDADIIIDNNGTLDDFKKNVSGAIDRL